MTSMHTYWVLVPFYDNLGYLRETMQSVIDQTDPDWRAIVVDDSVVHAEGVASLVAELADDRVTTVRNATNLGVAGSFNRCFELANEHGAELAMILHADDLLEPQYIQTVRAVHAADVDATCVAPRVTVIGSDGSPRRALPDTVKAWLWPKRLHRLEGEQGLRLLLRGQFFYCPAVSYRMADVVVPAWNERWTQVMDLELYARILLRGGSIALGPERVFRYRRHEHSMTQLNSATMVRTVEETDLCRAVAADARALGWPRAARAGRVRATVRLQALLQAGALLISGRFRSAGRAVVLSVSR